MRRRDIGCRALMTRQPSPEGFDLLGYAYEQQNKLDQAEEAYGRAVELNPGSQYSKAKLGIVFGKRGKHPDCIAILEGTS